jgi:hypothetical protein
LNPNFETGSKLVQEVSQAETGVCHDNMYKVCTVDDPRIAQILAENKDDSENGLAIGLGHVAAGILVCCGALYVIGKRMPTMATPIMEKLVRHFKFE